jgi:hypothetical protein
MKLFSSVIFFSVFRMGLSRAKVRYATRYSGGAMRYKANVAMRYPRYRYRYRYL